MTDSKRAYNFNVTQTTDADVGQNAKGTAKIKFTGEFQLRGKTVSRTILAQGKAAELVRDMIGKGNVLGLRCVFDHAPGAEEGKRGGEYLTVVDLPREKKAA